MTIREFAKLNNFPIRGKLTHGALSRHAKGVYICEACGTDEALRDWIGNVKPLSDWVLVRVYNGDLRR